MTLSKLNLRRCLVLVLALLVIGGLGWWALWRIAAARYDRVLDGWVAEGRAQGYVIDWDDRRLFGFPRHVVLRIANLRWKNTEGVTFHAGDTDIAAGLWQSRIFDTKFKGKAEIAVPLDAQGRALVMAGEDGAAHIELDADGVWKLCRVVLNSARIGRNPDVLFLAGTLRAAALRPDVPPKDHHDTGLTITALADAVTLPPAMPPSFGATMQKLDLGLRVMGPMPDFRRRDSVDTWNKDSGVVEFDKLHMEWGPLLLAGKGTVGFDDDLQPEGAFASVVGNQDKVLEILGNSGFIATSQAQMLQSALGVFAKPAKSDGVDGIGVPITIQLGGLFLGPVKVFGFPEIIWSNEPVPGAAAVNPPAP